MKQSGFLMIVGSLLLLGLFYFPLWNITLGAPQYPDPLGMNIYINGVQGVETFDLQNIDAVNKYIGMKKIPKEGEMWEFIVFPKVILGMTTLGLLVGIAVFFQKINYRWILAWLILMLILGIFGMYDFNAWLLDYGTDLNPNAIIKLTDTEGNPLSYKPPLLGTAKILNFTAQSYPGTGAYFMILGLVLVAVAFRLGTKKLNS